MRRSTGRAWFLAGALCVAVVLADQAVKALVEARLTTGEDLDVFGPLGLTLTHNRGVAFGLAGGTGAPLVLVTLAGLAVIGYLFAHDPQRPGMWVAAGLLAGGAVGNLADRVRVGEVTDFVKLPPWPPFNLADVSITAGIVLLLLLYMRDTTAGREGG